MLIAIPGMFNTSTISAFGACPRLTDGRSWSDRIDMKRLFISGSNYSCQHGGHGTGTSCCWFRVVDKYSRTCLAAAAGVKDGFQPLLILSIAFGVIGSW